MAKYHISADVGGTFTDIFIYEEESGEVLLSKCPSTPDNPALAVLAALDKSGISIPQAVFFSHGTTVGTNALIQRKIARTGLITTQGFRDLLEIRRGNKLELWDAYQDVASPPIPRRDRAEVAERVNYRGEIVQALDEKGLRQVVRIFKRKGIESIAICFLSSYINGANEKRAKEIVLEENPDLYVCVSSEILPEIFEFERTSTTVINACLAPIISHYLKDMIQILRKKGYRHDILVMHSAGGVMTAERAVDYAARLTNSGPAAGAAAGAYFAQLCGFNNAITLDMGGTSADVSLTYQGETRITREWSVEFGYPIAFPCVDMVSIGAGGGSVAWIDEGGSLRNGPQSMGADPGPACYLKGGTEPTNTDANLVLERLNPHMFLGGEMRVDKEQGRKVIQEKIAEPLGYSPVEAADAIIRIANANMIDAIRLISVRKGYDPREFVLVGFGGAGPLHCAHLARELEIPTVVIPPWPGITSALGCLLVDLRHDFSKTVIMSTRDPDIGRLEEDICQLEREAAERLREEGLPDDRIQILRYLDLQYVGQWRSLTVVCPHPLNISTIQEASFRFHQEHEREYMYSRPDQEVEVHGLRVSGLGLTRKPEFKRHPGGGTLQAALKGQRKVFFSEVGGFSETSVYDRAKLSPGLIFGGPAILEQMDSTVVVPPGMRARVDDYLNLIIDVNR